MIVKDSLSVLQDSIRSIKDTAQTAIDSTLALPMDSLSNDSLALGLPLDSLSNDSLAPVVRTFDLPTASDGLDETIIYSAEDSIIYDIVNERIYLYGTAHIEQGKIKLDADLITFNYTDQTVQAEGRQDSLGNWIGKPLFQEGEEKFGADEMTYNFKTKKGKISDLITQEGDGFLRSEKVKKNEYDELFGANTYYTTCNLEHPHYRIESKRVKIVPDELIVTGPAKFIVDDVPTPLVVPFGIFPLTEERRSGLILPNYGQSPGQGFYLRNGGFYLGINDYMDLAIRGDLYSRGTWQLNLASQYKKLYRYNGNVSINFGKRKSGDPITDSFSSSNDFRISWTHSQAAQARPNSSFSASVQLGSSSYGRNFVTTTNDYLSNTLTSSINYSKSFPGTPFNMSANANHSQNNQTGRVAVTLPEFTLNMNKVFPFKQKTKKGKTQWYEKVSVGYRGNFRNRIEVGDSVFFNIDTLLNNMTNGVKHNVPINTNLTLLKYITVSPSFIYDEYWYFESTEKEWNPAETYDSTFTYTYDTIYDDIDTIITTIANVASIDTTFGNLISRQIPGFKTAREFRASINLNTRIYGVKQGMNLGPIKAFRHVLRPSAGLTWRPDFGSEFWGYYKDVQSNAGGDTLNYSIFEEGTFSSPPKNKSALLTFSVDNNLEIKTASKNDTTTKLKKLKLLESLRFSSNYDFNKDSLKFGDIKITARTTLLNRKLNFNFNATYSPYAVNATGKTIDVYQWKEESRLGRLKSADFSLNTSFSSKQSSNNTSDRGTEQERDDVLNNLDSFIDFKIPWKIRVSYNFRINRSYQELALVDNKLQNFEDRITQTLNLNIDLNITPKWKVNMSTGYDFTNKALAYTTIDIYRDLHCWNMSFNWVPTGDRKRYEFTLRANSSLLQDLKLQRKRDWFDF